MSTAALCFVKEDTCKGQQYGLRFRFVPKHSSTNCLGSRALLVAPATGGLWS